MSTFLVGVAVGMLAAIVIIAAVLWAAARLSGAAAEQDRTLQERPDDMALEQFEE